MVSSFVIEICFFVGDWNTFFFILSFLRSPWNNQAWSSGWRPVVQDRKWWPCMCEALCLVLSTTKLQPTKQRNWTWWFWNSGLKSRKHVGFASVVEMSSSVEGPCQLWPAFLNFPRLLPSWGSAALRKEGWVKNRELWPSPHQLPLSLPQVSGD